MNETARRLYNNYLSKQLDYVFNVEKNDIPQKPEELKKNQIYSYQGRILDVDEIGSFKNGFAIVRKTISKKNNLPESVIRDFELRGRFHIPRVETINYYHFIDKNYRMISNELNYESWYLEARDFCYGMAVVKSGSKSFYIKSDGKPLGYNKLHDTNSLFHDKAYDFLGDVGITLKNGYALLVNRKGDCYVIGNNYWFSVGEEPGKDYIRTRFYQRLNFIRNLGEETVRKASIFSNKSFIVVKNYDVKKRGKTSLLNEVIPLSNDLKDYKVYKLLINYEVSNKKDKYTLKCEPIKIYDKRFTICKKNEQLFLYDRSFNSYTKIGSYYTTWFDDNIIVNYDGERVEKAYLIYNEKLIDITYYYQSKLANVEEYGNINKDVNLMDYDEFYHLYEDKVKREYRERRLMEDAEKTRLSDEQILSELTDKKNTREELIKEHEEVKNDALESIVKGLEALENYELVTGEIVRIKYDNIFNEFNGHKEIKPVILEKNLLKHIDLSNQSFSNVKIAGIDFRGCNISLNPQEVYPQDSPDLRNCNFEGIYFPVSTDFTNVHIEGARFTRKESITTFDINNENLLKGFYDENTTLNGIPIEELKREKKGRKRA